MTQLNAEEILVDMACLDRGLVPTGIDPYSPMHAKLKIAFKGMTSDDIRKAKRKYRKVFRKAVAWKIRESKKLVNRKLPGQIRREQENRLRTGILLSVGLLPDDRPVNTTQRYRRRRFVIEYLTYHVVNSN